MKLVRGLIFCLLVILTSGCATRMNMMNAEKYYYLGLEEESRGNYSGAKEAYWRALVNYHTAGAPKAYISASMYNFGRMAGHTCDYPKAAEYLQQALSMEKKIADREFTPNITKRLGELARLSSARKMYKESADYYQEMIPGLESLGVPGQDPIGFANLIDDYASVLSKIDQEPLAQIQHDKAERIRRENSDAEAIFKPEYYERECGSS